MRRSKGISSVNGWFFMAVIVFLGLSDSMFKGIWRLLGIQAFWLVISLLLVSLKFILPRFYKLYLLRMKYRNSTKHKKQASKQVHNDKELYAKEIQPLYEEAKTLFTHLLKTKQLSRDDILSLKIIIDNNLGVFSNYYRQYRFENDAKEIYVKMKNFNLSKSNFNEILGFLKSKHQY